MIKESIEKKINHTFEELIKIFWWFNHKHNRISNEIQYMLNAQNLHRETFKGYKNINNGKDVVLLATGPSLNDFEPIKNAVYVGVNRAFLYDKAKLDYLFLQDYSGLDYIEKAGDYKGNNVQKFYGIMKPELVENWIIPESIAIRHNAKRYYANSIWDEKAAVPDVPFAYDITSQALSCFGSVVFPAMQFILYTNPKRIYLVGCDCNLNGNFNDKKKNQLNYQYVIENWIKLKDFAKMFYPETEIISVNPKGLKGIFESEIYTKNNEEKQDFTSFLLQNKQERMDANRTDIFNEQRAEFHKARYNFACQYTKNKKCLDVASGLGYGADILSKQGQAKSVNGIEINNDAVEYANAIYKSSKVKFAQGDIRNLPFKDKTFDIITSFETLEHITDEGKQFEEINRVLADDGNWILSVPNNWVTDKDNPHHVKTYTYKSIKEALSRYFKIVEMYNQNSGVDWVENKKQKKGIIKTTTKNSDLAEVFIIVCKKNNIFINNLT